MNLKLLNANLCAFAGRLIALHEKDNFLWSHIARRFLYLNESESQAAHVLRELDALETEIKVMRYHLLKGMWELPPEIRKLIPQLTEAKASKARLPARYEKDRIRRGCKPISEPRDEIKKRLVTELHAIAYGPEDPRHYCHQKDEGSPCGKRGG